MSGCPNRPKNWADKFFLIRPLPGVHPWWIGEDDRPLFRTNWGIPRVRETYVCDWTDLKRVERLAALKLVVGGIFEPVGLDPLFFAPCKATCKMFQSMNGGGGMRRAVARPDSEEVGAPEPARCSLPPHEVPMPEASIDPPQVNARGKGRARADKRPKRNRPVARPSVHSDPSDMAYDPFAAMGWTPDLPAYHNEAIEAITNGEVNPSMEAARTAARSHMFVMEKLFQSGEVVDRLVREKKNLSAQLEREVAERNIVQSRLENLQEDFGRLSMQNFEYETKLANLETDHIALKTEMAEQARKHRWENTRVGYSNFKNAVNQLRLVNPNLVTKGICPNKFVFGGNVIRDWNEETDPPDSPFADMPEDYGTIGYQSEGDADFPYYEGPYYPPGCDGSAGTSGPPV